MERSDGAGLAAIGLSRLGSEPDAGPAAGTASTRCAANRSSTVSTLSVARHRGTDCASGTHGCYLPAIPWERSYQLYAARHGASSRSWRLAIVLDLERSAMGNGTTFEDDIYCTLPSCTHGRRLASARRCKTPRTTHGRSFAGRHAQRSHAYARLKRRERKALPGHSTYRVHGDSPACASWSRPVMAHHRTPPTRRTRPWPREVH